MSVRASSTKGFTVVELIIVIATLAIIASITVISYGSWRVNLTKKQMQSDLNQAAVSLRQARNFNNVYPAPSAGQTVPGFSPSAGVTIAYKEHTDTTYCIEATSPSAPSVAFYATHEKDAREGTCAGGDNAPPAIELPPYDDTIALTNPNVSCGLDMTTRPANGAYNPVPCDNGTITIVFQDANSATPSYIANQPGPFAGVKSVRFTTVPGNYYIEHNGGGGNTPYSSNANKWSTEIWVKFNSDQYNRAIVSAQDLWGIRTTSNGFSCDRRVGSPWMVASAASSAVSPALNTWYHVACTYDNGTMKLYVNGVQRAVDVNPNTANSGGGKLVFGNQGNLGGNGFLDGWLTQFNFYKDKTLTPEEIATRYSYAE